MSEYAKGTEAVASAPVPSPAVLDTMVKMIMGQTEMTHDEVVSALERTNYDLKRVIREYMRGDSNNQPETGVSSSSSSSSSSTNQLRFSEIRQFMDTSDQMYYRRQEMAKIHQQVLERKKAQADAAAAASAAASKL
jgi:hypothetical protein